MRHEDEHEDAESNRSPACHRIWLRVRMPKARTDMHRGTCGRHAVLPSPCLSTFPLVLLFVTLHEQRVATCLAQVARKAATSPFVTRNAELLDLLAPQFEEQLRQYKEEDSFLELVRRTIQDKLTGHRPSIDTISRALHIGPRTLQRRLQDSGSSFQRVLDEARHQMARYYLSNSALELNEAAYLLGYEDPNSFGRAFRTWEGMPPSDWREMHRPTKVT